MLPSQSYFCLNPFLEVVTLNFKVVILTKCRIDRKARNGNAEVFRPFKGLFSVGVSIV